MVLMQVKADGPIACSRNPYIEELQSKLSTCLVLQNFKANLKHIFYDSVVTHFLAFPSMALTLDSNGRLQQSPTGSDADRGGTEAGLIRSSLPTSAINHHHSANRWQQISFVHTSASACEWSVRCARSFAR